MSKARDKIVAKFKKNPTLETGGQLRDRIHKAEIDKLQTPNSACCN